MRKLEIIRVIATIVLAVVAMVIMCLMIFKPETAQADDIVTMATLNQYKEEVQTKISKLEANITELEDKNADLKEEIAKLKKADATIKTDVSDVMARERYFYEKAAKADGRYIPTIARQILTNLY